MERRSLRMARATVILGTGLLAAGFLACEAPPDDGPARTLDDERTTGSEGREGSDAPLVAEDGTIDLGRYYTASESDRILRELHALHPELTEVHTIGQSLRGAELLVMEVTNRATGPAAEKPALYVDGGLHAGELTGSAVALHLLVHLLSRYGDDPEVTSLVDGRVFYIRPKFNPDGSDLVLTEDRSLRSSVRPVDEDGDGQADEDPGDDLDGDGWITRMRIPDSEGPWYADPVDPRILRRVDDDDDAPRDAIRYRVVSEGIDNDGDGRLNEDGVGGLDLNRNFPRNWEREHLQPGAGDFPLSEPETWATVRFIHDHPNITGIVHGHTSGGFVYRLPSASDPTRFPPNDLALIEHLGAEYTRTTGRPVRPSSTHPTDHRYGTLISWGYWDEGVVGWVPEYSPGPEAWVPDYDGDGDIEEEEELRYDDEELGGRYFSPWTPYDHPEYGSVEIGGWHSTFWGQNPPAEHLEEETRLQLPWHLYLAAQAPLLALDPPSVLPAGDGFYRLSVTVRNEGFLPTSATGRGAVGRPTGSGLSDQVVSPPHVEVELTGAELVEGVSRTRIPHLRGTGPFLQDVGPATHTLTWTIRPISEAPTARVIARAVKAGTVRSEPVPIG